MGRPKGKGKKNETDSEGPKSKAVTPVAEEASGDEEVPIPSQEHCTWLLNIIRLHAKEISSAQLKEFENDKVHHSSSRDVISSWGFFNFQGWNVTLTLDLSTLDLAP